ncbi:alpha/beta hydrolase [Marmoricola sp. RAF53]|uniref:alpha/beta hydrolase n=1 Tax=Marmoricola sp. RAF53 TaxID=3233059 RepID=UPI003F94DE70
MAGRRRRFYVLLNPREKGINLMGRELEPVEAPTWQRARFEVEAENQGQYQIDVSLPFDYLTSDDEYPVVVVLDGNYRFEAVHGIVNGLGPLALNLMVPAAIVVGVGYPESDGQASWYARRNHDFFGPWDMTDAAGRLVTQVFNAMTAAEGRSDLTLTSGGADRFLSFLGEELIPALARRYRVDRDRGARHTLVGESSGGHFVLHALYHPNSPFHRYLAVSPAFGIPPGAIVRREGEFAAERDDHDVEVYLAAAGTAMTSGPHALGHEVSGVAWVREQFAIRAWPSARIHAELLDGEQHGLAFARAAEAGLRFLLEANRKRVYDDEGIQAWADPDRLGDE